MAKTSLNISKEPSSTQNADILEALLLAFEEKVQRRREMSTANSILANQLSSLGYLSYTPSSSESDKSLQRPIASSTPRSRLPLAFDDQVSESPVPKCHSSSSSPPVSTRNFQISTEATQDDPVYFATEGGLRSLFSFFASNPFAKCFFCSMPFDMDFLPFKRQGHAVSISMPCLCGDSVKWLSSPIMGGSIQKYYVNMSPQKSLQSFGKCR